MVLGLARLADYVRHRDAHVGAIVGRYANRIAGEQGFPGELRVQVRYSLGRDLSWRIDYEAETDAPTLVNLTHHDYVNLAGQGSALGHELCVPASRYSEAGPDLAGPCRGGGHAV